METKICGCCKIEKTLDNFAKKLNGLSSKCKPCVNAYGKKWYRKNRTQRIIQNTDDKKRNGLIVNRKVVEYLRSHPCVDCGFSDPLALQFDHRGDKEFDVSTALHHGCRWPTVEKEIAKCDVRCANCHHIKTAIQRKHLRALILGRI